MAANLEPDKKGIFIGATFTSFEELEKEIIKYQRENFVQLYKRDSRTIDAALRRAGSSTLVSSIPRWCTRVFMEGRNSNLSPRGKDHNSSKSKSVIIVILPYLCSYD